MIVCVIVCLPPRPLITSGVMWHDMDSIQMIGKVVKGSSGRLMHMGVVLKKQLIIFIAHNSNYLKIHA